MNNLYPLTFKTIFKEKIWGGDKIKTFLHKDFSPLPNCGETWELSAVKGDESIVAFGDLSGQTLTQLIEQFKGDLLGNKIYNRFGNQFPLLIKFIDANQDLSVQVHPDDSLAKILHGEGASGKTEMWYIMQADKGSTLIAGFSQKLDKQEFRNLVEDAQLEKVLNKIEVEAGDVFFIPAGRVHTIGKGILLAEIQQTSDITYRIYDFDRKDVAGNKRELHIENALEALDFDLHESYKTPYKQEINVGNLLVDSPYFTTNKWVLKGDVVMDYSDRDSFVILILTSGDLNMEYENTNYTLHKGDVYLIPASCSKFSISTFASCEFLEVYIR